jgi:hypothetical protein
LEVAGIRVVVNVSWPETTFSIAGAGEIQIWMKSAFVYTDKQFTGTVKACGIDVPDIEKSAMAGGGLIQTQFPSEIWDAPSNPGFAISGSVSGYDSGDTFSSNPFSMLLGATMTDPLTDPWPATGQEMVGDAVDFEGDGEPGMTGFPNGTAPYTLPPVSLLAALTGPFADQLYVARRVNIQLEGTSTSCTSVLGTAVVSKLDDHVMGCQVEGGAECEPAEAQYIDDNRPVYVIGDATYEMVQVADNATCFDVRAALPP